MKGMYGKVQVVPHSGSWMRWSTAGKADQEKYSKEYFIKETSPEHWGVLLHSVIWWPGGHFRKTFFQEQLDWRKQQV